MSQGRFTRSKYQSNQTARIYSIRVQPETLTLTIDGTPNDPPSGDITESVSARARGSRRSIGITARAVSVEFTSTLPTGYTGEPLTVPVMTPSLFETAAIGATGTYLGQPIEVIGLRPESRR